MGHEDDEFDEEDDEFDEEDEERRLMRKMKMKRVFIFVVWWKWI